MSSETLNDTQPTGSDWESAMQDAPQFADGRVQNPAKAEAMAYAEKGERDENANIEAALTALDPERAKRQKGESFGEYRRRRAAIAAGQRAVPGLKPRLGFLGWRNNESAVEDANQTIAANEEVAKANAKIAATQYEMENNPELRQRMAEASEQHMQRFVQNPAKAEAMAYAEDEYRERMQELEKKASNGRMDPADYTTQAAFLDKLAKESAEHAGKVYDLRHGNNTPGGQDDDNPGTAA